MKRIAWVSPLSPLPLLHTARFSRDLLPLLSKQFDIEIFVDDHDSALLRGNRAPNDPACGLPVFHYHRIFERNSSSPFDLFVYQLEDTPRCNFVRLTSAIWPGICYFHDRNLNDLYYGLYRHTTAPTEINELVEQSFGHTAPKLGDYHVRRWSAEIFDSLYVHGKDAARRAVLAAVFSEFDRRALAEVRGDSPIIVSPRAVSGERPLREVQRTLRSRLGAADDSVLIAYGGERYLADRFVPTIRAFRRLRAEFRSERQVELLWIVPGSSARQRAERCLGRFPDCADGIMLFEPASEEEFRAALSLCSLCFGMRFDPGRSLPAAVPAAMDLGVPVLTADYAVGAELGAASAALPIGRGEEQYLALAAALLLRSPQALRALAERGRGHAHGQWTPKHAAGAFTAAVVQHGGLLEERLRKAERAVAAASESLLQGVSESLDGEDGSALQVSQLVLKRCAEEFGWAAV